MAFVAGGYPLYYDAVNEKGLGMAGLNFVGNAAYEEEMCIRDRLIVCRQFHETLVADFAVHIVLIQPLDYAAHFRLSLIHSEMCIRDSFKSASFSGCPLFPASGTSLFQPVNTFTAFFLSLIHI